MCVIQLARIEKVYHAAEYVHETRWSKEITTSVTEYRFKKWVRTVVENQYSDWEFGGWTDWSTDDSKTDTSLKKYTHRESRTTTDTKKVYYNPNGEPTETLTEANWTTVAPGNGWTFVDERDRKIKDAWIEEIVHPAVSKPCKGKPKSRTFQIDTYSNPTAKLAKKAQGYDNDNKLKWGEDKAHYGNSKWQIVTIKGYDNWTKKQWMTAINLATTKKGVGNVNSTSHIKTVKKKQKLTVAWELEKNSWPKSSKRKPQIFFARGVK